MAVDGQVDIAHRLSIVAADTLARPQCLAAQFRVVQRALDIIPVGDRTLGVADSEAPAALVVQGDGMGQRRAKRGCGPRGGVGVLAAHAPRATVLAPQRTDARFLAGDRAQQHVFMVAAHRVEPFIADQFDRGHRRGTAIDQVADAEQAIATGDELSCLECRLERAHHAVQIADDEVATEPVGWHVAMERGHFW